MSAELEQAVLGAALNNPNAIPTLAAKLTPNDFFEPRHAVIWKAILGQWGDGKPSDPVAVLTRLQGQGDDVRVGGAPYIFELVKVAAVPATLDHHADNIRAAAATRRLTQAGHQIQQLADQLPAPDALSEAQKLLDNVLTVKDGEVTRISDTLDGTLEAVHAMQNGETPSGLMSGLHALDDLTGGLRGGQMVVVAARPGVGKSTLSVDMMRHASIRLGVPSLIYSLEMSKDEINQRIVSAEAEVKVENIIRGKLTDDDWGRIGAAAERIKTAPIFMDDSPSLTMMDIIAKSKMLTQQKGIGLIIVDYIQLLRAEGVTSREQEVAGYSRQFKMLAKACNVPVVVVAQVNREVERRGDDAKLKISDLRESGALEQDADMILLINRYDQNDSDHARAGEVDVNVAKNRGGKTGTATLAHRLHYSQFSNMKE